MVYVRFSFALVNEDVPRSMVGQFRFLGFAYVTAYVSACGWTMEGPHVPKPICAQTWPGSVSRSDLHPTKCVS